MINDLDSWLNKISIKYKGYEIKNAIIALKIYQYQKTKSSKITTIGDLKDILSYLKWNIKFKILKNIANEYKTTIEGYCNLMNLEDKNLYVINFSPIDSRNFLHIAPLAEKDKNSFVITLRKDVYNYFYKKEKPVILFNVNNLWINKKKLEIEIPTLDYKKYRLQSLDVVSMIILSRATSIIDLLEMEIKKRGLPKTLITLQDSYYFDSTFASYFLKKIPTVTLQHGLISGDKDDIIWKYIISDKIIVWSNRQSEVLKSLGLNNERIEVLGTAKYDLYLEKINNRFSLNNYKRVLLGIQQDAFYPKNKDIIYAFIKDLISLKGNYQVCIRFHPGIKKKEHSKFIQKLINNDLINYKRIICSNINDPLEDISASAVVLTSCSSLAAEAMLLKKPVIEYLSKKESSQKYNDYRDFSLHALKGNEAAELIVKLIEDTRFYKRIVEIQNKFINSEILSPPVTANIINYIDNLIINGSKNND